MAGVQTRQCSRCGKTFTGTCAYRSKWRHEKTCRGLAVRRVDEPEAAAAEPIGSSSSVANPVHAESDVEWQRMWNDLMSLEPTSTTEGNRLTMESDGAYDPWLCPAVGFDAEEMFGFDHNPGMDVEEGRDEPAATSAVSRIMTRAETVEVVDRAKAIGIVVSAERFVETIQVDFPHWPREVILGIRDAFVPAEIDECVSHVDPTGVIWLD